MKETKPLISLMKEQKAWQGFPVADNPCPALVHFMQENHLEKPWLERLESPESSKLFQARPLEGPRGTGQGKGRQRQGRSRAGQQGRAAGRQPKQKKQPYHKAKKTQNPPKLRCRAGQNRAGQQGGRVGGRGEAGRHRCQGAEGQGQAGSKRKNSAKTRQNCAPKPYTPSINPKP